MYRKNKVSFSFSTWLIICFLCRSWIQNLAHVILLTWLIFIEYLKDTLGGSKGKRCQTYLFVPAPRALQSHVAS